MISSAFKIHGLQNKRRTQSLGRKNQATGNQYLTLIEPGKKDLYLPV